MNRARLIGTLLALIVLACIAVIVLDQRGFFEGQPSSSPTWTAPAPQPVPIPAPAPVGSDGYGDL